MGFFLERNSSMAMIDFKGVYTSARCLLEGSDPYNEEQLRRVYVTEGGARPSDPLVVRRVVVKNLYLPTGLSSRSRLPPWLMDRLTCFGFC